MKKLLLTLAAAAICGSAWAETAVFNFVPENDNPYNWNTLKKDASGYLLNENDEKNVSFKITEAPVSIQMEGQCRRNTQRAFGGLNCLCVYKNFNFVFTIANGYKMTGITFVTATNKAPNLTVTKGECTLEAEEETGIVYNHTESGAELAQTTRSLMCNTPDSIVVSDPANGGTQVLTAIEVEYEASTLKDAGLQWSTKEFTAFMGQENAYPTLAKATTAAIDYTSENEEVATIDAATGVITLVAPGETKIIAGCDAAGEYDWGEASYILTVKRNGEISAIYDFTKITIGDDKLGHMTDYPEIPYDGNKSFWWTTNPNEEGTYAAGSQFKPLTITNEGSQITFQWGGKSGHGNLRATSTGSPKVNNLQLGGGAATAIKSTVEGAKLYDVVVYINNNNDKFATTVEGLETNDEGSISSDDTANTITWTPKTEDAECYLDWEGGAYITQISVNYHKASSGIAAPAVENADAPVEYFNLQGIRVANPANGLFIKRQGNAATKVFIK